MVFLKKLPSQPQIFLRQLNSRALYAFCYGSLPQRAPPPFKSTAFSQQEQKGSANSSDVAFIISKLHDHGGSHREILQSLIQDGDCNTIQVSHDLVSKLLSRFKDDWKSALAVFKWADSNPNYSHSPGSYDLMVDILGKMKQMEQMNSFLDQMRRGNLVTLKTLGKAMRRFAGCGQHEDAVRLFDKLDTFGLKKDTESMNLLMDTLCKERRVEQAREIFLDLKSHIRPDANTFNIFIHGWCKVNRVEEAYWTLQEMIGCGVKPCVISYSTIVQFHCQRGEFCEAYRVLDEMEAKGCPANVVTYTTILSHLTKYEGCYDQSLKILERMKKAGCKPDTLFYNALIHMLGKAGNLKEAIRVFKIEMPKIGVVPNTSTYNSIIAMFCHHGQQSWALDLLREMEESMICEPDAHTYYPLLKSCLKSGKVDGLLSQLLDDMVTKHHLSLDLSGYKLLIHGLCRANRCEWAYRLFEEMVSKDIKPRYQTCNVLLEEVRSTGMVAAAAKIEAFMKEV